MNIVNRKRENSEKKYQQNNVLVVLGRVTRESRNVYPLKNMLEMGAKEKHLRSELTEYDTRHKNLNDIKRL